jgi:hypothetical protein
MCRNNFGANFIGNKLKPLFIKNQKVTVMKTKAFLLLCIIAFLGINTVKAQNGVVKVQICNPLVAQENPCIPGEYLFGEVCADNFFSNHNWITIDHGSTITGYLDEAGTIPSGNVYRQKVSITGDPNKNEEIFTLQLHQDGKLVQVMKWRFHIITNANGEVTAYMDNWEVICK